MALSTKEIPANTSSTSAGKIVSFEPHEPRYTVVKLLGKGAFGRRLGDSGYVLEAVNDKTKKRVAWKRMLKTTNNMSREIDLLKRLRFSQNVISIENYFYSKNYAEQIIQNIVLELGEYDLERFIYKTRKGTRIPLDEVRAIMRGVVSGVRDMHGLNVCHRDLKP